MLPVGYLTYLPRTGDSGSSVCPNLSALVRRTYLHYPCYIVSDSNYRVSASVTLTTRLHNYFPAKFQLLILIVHLLFALKKMWKISGFIFFWNSQQSNPNYIQIFKFHVRFTNGLNRDDIKIFYTACSRDNLRDHWNTFRCSHEIKFLRQCSLIFSHYAGTH